MTTTSAILLEDSLGKAAIADRLTLVAIRNAGEDRNCMKSLIGKRDKDMKPT